VKESVFQTALSYCHRAPDGHQDKRRHDKNFVPACRRAGRRAAACRTPSGSGGKRAPREIAIRMAMSPPAVRISSRKLPRSKNDEQ
jgi:hypothetical protein